MRWCTCTLTPTSPPGIRYPGSPAMAGLGVSPGGQVLAVLYSTILAVLYNTITCNCQVHDQVRCLGLRCDSVGDPPVRRGAAPLGAGGPGAGAEAQEEGGAGAASAQALYKVRGRLFTYLALCTLKYVTCNMWIVSNIFNFVPCIMQCAL